MDVVTVFLSSTQGDLAGHRKAVYQAINRLDGYYCVRMEDLGPRDALPTELCVQKVKECDCYVALVGLLHGSCPEGDERSYTEIEYDTAVQAKKPRFVCTCPPDFQVPGHLIETDEERRKQRAFRARIDRERHRATFSLPEGAALWVVQAIHNWQSSVSGLQAEESMKATGAMTQAPSAGGPQAVHPPGADEASSQRLEMLRGLTSAFTEGEIDFREKDSESVTPFHSARLLLMAKTLFGRRCEKECLSTHEMNSLYRHRSQLKPGGWELETLWRSLIEDSHDVVPGWYWFKDADPKGVEGWLWYTAARDNDARVKAEALGLLRKTKTVLDPQLFDKADVLALIASDRAAEVQRALFLYLAENGTPEHLPLIERLLAEASPGLAEPGASALWAIRVRSDAPAGFGELLQRDQPDPEAIRLFYGKQDALPVELIAKATAHQNDKVRAFAVRALAARQQLSKEQAYALLNDSSRIVRAACYRHLIALGERFPPDKIREFLQTPTSTSGRLGRLLLSEEERVDVDGIVYELYRKYGYEELVQDIDWMSLESPTAYRVMAEEHFDKAADRIRQELDNGFESLREQWVARTREDVHRELGKTLGAKAHLPAITRVLSKLVDKPLGQVMKKEEEHREFRRGRFLAAALAGLARHGAQGDLPIARRCLADRKPDYYGAVEVEAARIIERFGDNNDVPQLVAAAKELYGEQRQALLEAALRLSPGPNGVAKDLLDEESSAIVGLTMDWLRAHTGAGARALLEDCLADQDGFKRVKAVSYLVEICSNQEREDLLNRYIGEGAYFYDVVCWLDRYLFAPEPLRSLYREKLLAK